MGYSNFIPNIWSKDIMEELKKNLVFGDGCWNVYRGTVTKKGESVTFIGLGDPTITTIGREAAGNQINAAEELEDTSLQMPINQLSYYNVKIGDIDEAQSNPDVWGALKSKTATKMADTIDQYIAGLAKGNDCKKLYSSDGSAWSVSADNILTIFDAALEELYKNNVPKTGYIEAIVPPYMYLALKNKVQNLDTDNSTMLKNGIVGKYGNVVVKMSNNVAKDSNNKDCVMFRTKQAIGFANPLTHSEAYRPDLAFEDCLKGYSLYDAKVIRSNQIIVAVCQKA